MAHIYGILMLFFVFGISVSAANQPGAELVLSQDGVNYGIKVALDWVTKYLSGRQLPAYSGSDGDLQYGMDWGRINSFVRPLAVVTFDKVYGIRWVGSNVAMHISAGAWYKYTKWIVSVGDSVGVDAYVAGVSFLLDTHFNLIGDKIYPQAGECKVDVSTLNLEVHGGKWYLKWIYSVFRGLIESKIRSAVKDNVCAAIREQISINLGKMLASMNLQVDLNNNIFVDLGFTGAPQFTPDYMISYHKANIYWMKPEDSSPIEYKPMQGNRKTGRMMKLMFSEYVANALAYQADKHNLMKWRLPLKPEWLKYLENIELPVKCPATNISVFVESKSRPEDGVKASISARLTLLCGGTKVMLAIDLAMTVKGSIHLEDKQIKPNIKVENFTFDIPKPIPPGLDVAQLRAFVTMAVHTVAEAINEKSKIDISNIMDNLVPNVRFENAALGTEEATAIMEMDIHYVG